MVLTPTNNTKGIYVSIWFESTKQEKSNLSSPNTNCLKMERQRKSRKPHQEILAIHKTRKGIPARTFGAQAVWANCFRERRTAMKRASEINDAPPISYDFGFPSSLSLVSLLRLAPLWTWSHRVVLAMGWSHLILGSLTGALLLYLMYCFFIDMDGTKSRSERPSLWKSMPILVSHVPLGHRLVLYLLTSRSQPNYSRCFCHRFRSSGLVLRFYLRNGFNIKSSSWHLQTRR